MAYTELQVTTNFSFLRGASHPEEMVEQALQLGYEQIAITDRNTLAGIVRAHSAAKGKNIRVIVGCRLDLLDGPSLLAYPINKEGYAGLCNLLTLGNRRAQKGECHLYKKDIYQHAKDLLLIVVPPDALNELFDYSEEFKKHVSEYRSVFGGKLYMAASRLYNVDDLKQLYRLSTSFDIPMVATNDVHYHVPTRRELQDVVTCIREGCTITTAGYRLFPNAERYLKPIKEMKRLFRKYPQALENSQKIAQACHFSLDELKYEYPMEITSEDRTPQEELVFQTWRGAHRFYGQTIPEKIAASIRYELDFIESKNYASYFLTVYDIVRFARSKGILCQGRGSAANSTVCFCLGITAVDPTKFELLFERFISEARNEPPDIDVDFEHERREEVIQYIYQKYGRDRAAIVATVTQMHAKGAVRDVGRVMGLSVDAVNRLSAVISRFSAESFNAGQLIAQGFNPKDLHLRKVLSLTGQYIGFPRQLGQHTGGFVITKGKLSDLVPILNARMQDRTNIEWNKDDIDVMGFMKVDVLALGMLTCIRKAFDLVRQHYGRDLTLANIPQDDPAVYEMITPADTIGVFQIESRAQQSMLPRLKPKCFYDLVIEVAIVRPGPIIGNMVHPYLRRRNGEEPVTYPSKELENILGRTLGVPLFQEQAMQIAIVAAGFTGAEADELRRSMATFKVKIGVVKKFENKLIQGMLKNGYSLEYAQHVFKQLEGFGAYGFPESHAASFALLVYISAWIKCHYPDAFTCALLNSMPMGFYQPAQLVIDARNHGVDVRPVDINYSLWDNLLEEQSGKYRALRLGFRQIKGLREEDINILVAGRKQAYQSVDELRNTGLSDAALEQLADADAFRSIGIDRREALWQVTNKDKAEALFAGQPAEAPTEKVSLPLMSESEHVVQDYGSIRLSLKAHPISFVRPSLQQLDVVPAKDLANIHGGKLVKVAGLVLVRQRPGTAKGVCFITLEDETGNMNLVVFANIFDQYRQAILQSSLLMVEGKLQKEGQVIHVIVSRCHDLTKHLRQLAAGQSEKLPLLTLSRADEGTRPDPVDYPEKTSKPQNTQLKLFPEARNFK